MKNIKSISAIAIMLMIVLASCAKTTSPTPSSGSSDLVANWHKVFNGITLHLILKSDMTYSIGYDDSGSYVETSTGTYSNTATEATILTGTGANSCPTTHGVYGWSVSGSTLTVTLINDPCVDGNGQSRSSVAVGVYTK